MSPVVVLSQVPEHSALRGGAADTRRESIDRFESRAGVILSAGGRGHTATASVIGYL